MAFPYNQRPPPNGSEGRKNASVTSGIPGELRQPILSIAFRLLESKGAGVLMPKTAVNENDLPPRRKHDIWRARQIFAVEAKPISKTMHQSSDN